MNGLLELVADAYQRNIGNPARQLVGNGVRGLLGLDPADYADSFGMEAYRNAQALSNAPTPLAFAALPAAMVKGAKAAKAVESTIDSVGKLPTEREFYRQYAQHIDLRGRQSGDSLKNRESITQEGFRRQFGANALPPSLGGQPTDLIGKRFAPQVGDVVYLAPKDAWKDRQGRGMQVQSGWTPKPWEAVVIGEDDVGKPMYELFAREWKRHNGLLD